MVDASKPLATPAPASAGGSAPGANPPPVVAAGKPSAKGAKPGDQSTAGQLAAKHGGLRGGKPRADGLTPGSPEAKEADRKKDAERKKAARAAAVAADPPPLPPASSSPQATPGSVAGVPGAAPGQPAVIPWDASTLKPLLHQLVETAEGMSRKAIISRAEKAHVPGLVIGDIQRETNWNPMAKTAIEEAGSRVVAKYANKAGLSAEYQDEVILVTGIVSIGVSQMMILKRLDKLVEEQKLKNAPAKPNAQAAASPAEPAKTV